MLSTEDLAIYLHKSKDTEFATGYPFLYTDKGFISYTTVGEDTLKVLQAYGDGEYLKQVTIELAKAMGCTKIRCFTARSPKAYIKKYNASLLGYELEVTLADLEKT